ncbi:MAG: hypothetical protein LUQ11_16445 [Methylococcaceae bacterium]|nr:hypothetical protein [Methylococcaceae bacterium]
MKRTSSWLLIGLAACVFAGCSSLGGKAGSAVAEPTADKVLHATGFSRFEDNGNVPVNQRWLMAQQAAKLDAYRGLADLLYKEPLDGRKTVGSQVMSDEAYRVYLDTYLRGARAVDYRTVKDTLKATLELNLTPRFYRCMTGDADVVNQCLQDDKRLQFTRIGYKSATTTSVNMACGNRDCSDQLYVQGFSKDRNAVDNALLNAGLYDVEWTVHTAADLAGRFMAIQGFIYNGL